MKVLLAVHHFPPRYSAGAELYTYRLARWLIAHGHAAEVLCVEEADYERPAALEARHEPYEGVPVWRLSLGMAGTPFSWRYNHPLINAWVAEYVSQRRPDLLHLQGGYLIGAGVLGVARDADVPTAVTLHDYWFLCPRITLQRGDGAICNAVPDDPARCAWCIQLEQRRYKLPEQLSDGLAGRVWIKLAGSAERNHQAERRAYLKQAIEEASLVIAPSPFAATLVASMVAPKRLHTLPLGIDPAPVASPAPPPNGATLRLAYLGQIAPHKGVHLILEALKLLPPEGRPVELHIYGDHDAQPVYGAQLRRQAGERVHFHGRIANASIGEALSAADALLVASLWHEIGPLTVKEAHAVGRPVIAPNLGNLPYIVRDEVDGLLFTGGSASDLSRQIQRLRAEPKLVDRLARAARPHATVDQELSKLAGLYADVIATTTKPVLELT